MCTCVLLLRSVVRVFAICRRSGPFWALRDGNEFLAPFGHHLARIEHPEGSVGQYVLWSAGHFVAVVIKPDTVRVIDGSAAQDPTANVHSGFCSNAFPEAAVTCTR